MQDQRSHPLNLVVQDLHLHLEPTVLLKTCGIPEAKARECDSCCSSHCFRQKGSLSEWEERGKGFRQSYRGLGHSQLVPRAISQTSTVMLLLLVPLQQQ